MRIIGGRLGGRVITPPMGYEARPTTDFAREALFDILNNEYEFEDLKVLDLFSGTGAVSFEFCSRGAGHVWAVEMNPRNAAFISSQARTLGLSESISVVRDNVFDFLPLCRQKFDLIFADPPYALEGLDDFPDKVLSQGILYPDRYFILEHGAAHNYKNHPYFVKERKYGRVHFSFFEKPASVSLP